MNWLVPVSPVAENTSWCWPTVPVSRRFVKVATPLETAMVVVPASVAVCEGVEATTFADASVTRLPAESSTRITGCVVNAVPLVAPAAEVDRLSVAAEPNPMVIALCATDKVVPL